MSNANAQKQSRSRAKKMSAIKSVIITLPKTPAVSKASVSNIKLPTTILAVDKIKLEKNITNDLALFDRRIKSNTSQKRKQSAKHMELATLSLPVVTAGGMVLKQEDVVPVRPKKRRLDHLTWEEKLQRK